MDSLFCASPAMLTPLFSAASRGKRGISGRWSHALAGLLLFAAGGTPTSSAQPYEFTTFAGRASSGHADGIGIDARLTAPEGVVVDARGNLFVTDTGNHTIRRIAPDGTVSTLAGRAGFRGSADGVGAEARFDHPAGIALDASGNLFVADRRNHIIRRITPTGVVTTVAGTAGVIGSTDGSALTARFNLPSGLAFDPTGALIILDRGNHTVRRLASTGVVTTLAGAAGQTGTADGEGSAARFADLGGVTVDRTGNAIVTETYSSGGKIGTITSRIRQITSSGVVTTLQAIPQMQRSLQAPRGVAVDLAGNIVLADGRRPILWRLSPDGQLSHLTGSDVQTPSSPGVDGPAAIATVAAPFGLVFDASGTLFIADTGNNAIRKLTPAGMVSTIAGAATGAGAVDGGGSTARFRSPMGVAADQHGNVYVADTDNHTIRRITPDGVVTTLAGLAGMKGDADGVGSAARFSRPRGLALDPDGNLFVADSGNAKIRRVTREGLVSTYVSGGNSATGQAGASTASPVTARLADPVALAFTPSGDLLVADSGNHAILRITPAGIVSTVATGTSMNFMTFPRALAVDRIGNVYVAAATAGLVKVAPDGTTSLVSTTPHATRSQSHDGVAVDAEGNVFATGWVAIRALTAQGTISSIGGYNLGWETETGSADGVGTMAHFSGPTGIALGPRGELYVADTGNHTIRRGVPATNPARLINSSLLATLAAGDSVTLGCRGGRRGREGPEAVAAACRGTFVGRLWRGTPSRRPVARNVQRRHQGRPERQLERQPGVARGIRSRECIPFHCPGFARRRAVHDRCRGRPSIAACDSQRPGRGHGARRTLRCDRDQRRHCNEHSAHQRVGAPRIPR